ncbi:MAG: lipopolysaccharide biosynthesis protein [Planctomycetaceae bacterium]|nr:lipopolysaccharide biosynthesis protein [Planctomycetaceae bacterium]
MDSEKTGIAIRRDALSTLLVRVVGIGLMFGSTVLTSRVLGPYEFGIYNAALALATLLSALAPLGTDRVLVRNLSVRPDLDHIGPEIALSHRCTAVITGLLIPACLITSLVLTYVLDRPHLGLTAVLAIVMLVPLTVTYLRQWIAIPLVGTRKAVMPEQVLFPLLSSGLMGLLIWRSQPMTAWTATIVHAAMTLGIWLFSLRTGPLQKAYSAAVHSHQSSIASVPDRLSEGMPFVWGAIGAILCQKCMPLVVAAGCGFADTAHFSLAMMITALPAIPLGILNLSLVPQFARLHSEGNLEGARLLGRRSAVATFLTALVVSMAIWFGRPILLYFFDARYTLVIGLLPTLLLAVIVDCLTGPTIPVMQTMGMERTYSRALFTWIPIQLVMNYVLSSYLEADGAAIGYLLGRCLWNVMVVALIYRHHGFVMLPTFDLPSLPGLPRRPALVVGDSSSASVFPKSFPGDQESSVAA